MAGSSREEERGGSSDDLQVMEGCTANILALFKKLGTKRFGQRDVKVLHEQVLNLLERSLLSKTPLSEVFLWSKQGTTWKTSEIKVKTDTKQEMKVETDNKLNSDVIYLKLYVNKYTEDEVLYAEAKEDFINLLFSFFTFPLGSVVKLLDGCSSLGCADNLYASVKSLGESEDKFLKSKECENMLLNPKLAPFFGCSNQILKIDEMSPEKIGPKSLGGGKLPLSLVNPKLPNLDTKAGGRFVKGPGRYIVAGDLVVTSSSTMAVVKLINKPGPDCWEERTLKLGKAEALNLLKASLISDNALSHAFSSWKMRSKTHDLA